MDGNLLLRETWLGIKDEGERNLIIYQGWVGEEELNLIPRVEGFFIN